jgi:hypothetical protein
MPEAAAIWCSVITHRIAASPAAPRNDMIKSALLAMTISLTVIMQRGYYQ